LQYLQGIVEPQYDADSASSGRPGSVYFPEQRGKNHKKAAFKVMVARTM